MNILTFDIEDWYNNVFNNKVTDSGLNIEPTVFHLLDIIQEFDLNPIFFVVGQFAERHPELIKKISEKYDIGSHGYYHKLVYTQSYKDFEKDILLSVKVLEEITGKKVTKYRAPGFSIPNNEYLKVLFSAPIETDCSLSAVNHQFGKKITDFDRPLIIEYNGRRIKEFPPSTIKIFNSCSGFFGGGYFRLFPYFVLQKILKEKKDYSLMYLHPLDFVTMKKKEVDSSFFRSLKAKTGTQFTEKKLRKMLKNFNFLSINDAEKLINWDKIPLKKL